jgi:hypothetical protein
MTMLGVPYTQDSESTKSAEFPEKLRGDVMLKTQRRREEKWRDKRKQGNKNDNASIGA